MKKLINRFLVVALSVLCLLTACDNDDDNLGDTSIKAPTPQMTVTIPTTNTSFAEKDTTFNITITLSETQLIDTYVYLNVVEGNATLDEDFSLSGERIIIPAGRLTGSGSISFSHDDVFEQNETVTLQIGDARTVNATITPVTAKFTVMDATTPSDVDFSVSWAHTFSVGEEEFDLADMVDFDIYVYDENGDNIIGADAATGDEPEVFTLESDLPDGTYTIAFNPWNIVTTDLIVGGEPMVIDIPLKLTIHRALPESDLELEITGWATDDEGLFFQNDGVDTNGYAEYVMATVVKTGDTFEILDENDVSQGSMRKKVTFSSQGVRK